MTLLRAGYLEKQGNWCTAYRDRYFKLYSNGNLEYHENETMATNPKATPKGLIDLSAAFSVTVSGQTGFQITTKSRIWKLRSMERSDRDLWFGSVHKIWIQTRLLDHSANAAVPNPHSSSLFHLETPPISDRDSPHSSEDALKSHDAPYANEQEQELFTFLRDHNLLMLYDKLRGFQLFVDELSNIDLERDELSSLCGAQCLDLSPTPHLRIRLKTAIRSLKEDRDSTNIPPPASKVVTSPFAFCGEEDTVHRNRGDEEEEEDAVDSESALSPLALLPMAPFQYPSRRCSVPEIPEIPKLPQFEPLSLAQNDRINIAPAVHDDAHSNPGDGDVDTANNEVFPLPLRRLLSNGSGTDTDYEADELRSADYSAISSAIECDSTIWSPEEDKDGEVEHDKVAPLSTDRGRDGEDDVAEMEGVGDDDQIEHPPPGMVPAVHHNSAYKAMVFLRGILCLMDWLLIRPPTHTDSLTIGGSFGSSLLLLLSVSGMYNVCKLTSREKKGSLSVMMSMAEMFFFISRDCLSQICYQDLYPMAIEQRDEQLYYFGIHASLVTVLFVHSLSVHDLFRFPQ